MVAQARPQSPPSIFFRPIIILIFLLHVNTGFTADATITLEVDANEVYVGDTVTISIESIGLIDPLDTSILSQSAQYERETYGTRIFVQKGKVVDVKLRRMEFTATKSGRIVFGPVTAGEVSSNSVSVNVLDAVRSQWVPEQEDITIDVSVSAQKPYVHSQLIVDITLAHRFVIADETILLPEFDGFIVRSVFQERRTFTDESQRRRQIQWRYLLFPERSGELVIEPVSWLGTAIKSRPERASFNRLSKPITISVLPSPLEQNTSQANSKTTWWLPSSSLLMNESWSSELTALQAGDEITRTIEIKANNVLGSQIPAPVVLESRALSQTLIKEARQETITPQGIVASAEFTYRLNANSPIPVFLDTVRVPWWSTITDDAQEAIIPARRINVGLPDRADLLKKIAQESTGTSSLRLWWADADLIRLLMYGLTALLMTPIIVGATRRLRARFLATKRKTSIRKNLEQLVETQQWSQLGCEVDKLLPIDAGNRCELVLQEIYPKLYGTNIESIDNQAILELVKSIDLKPVQKTTAASNLVTL